MTVIITYILTITVFSNDSTHLSNKMFEKTREQLLLSIITVI